MLGKPIYKLGDKVKFKMIYDGKPYELEGSVEIIDAFGTFVQKNEPSYDVHVDKVPFNNDSQALFKHISESSLKPVE